MRGARLLERELRLRGDLSVTHDLGLYQSIELSRLSRTCDRAPDSQPLNGVGFRKRCVQRGIELRDDRRWQVRRSEEGCPTDRLEARQARFGQRRSIRQTRIALHARRAQDAHL